MIAAVTALAAAQLSGAYGPMLVAVNGGDVHGAFSEARVGNGSERSPQFSCYFSFKGQLRGDTALVTVQTPGEPASTGTLQLTSEGAWLRLESNQPGCAATSGDMVGQPYEVSRDSPGADWTSVGLIAAPAAMIRSAPRSRTRAVHKLSRGDAVAIRGRNGDWIEVIWPYGERPVSGWVRGSELTGLN